MHLNLENSIVLVTGGTASIGKAIVETFLEEGATVLYCSRNCTGKEFENEKAIGTKLDICDKEAVGRWIQDSADKFGGLDIVVSNVSALAVPDTPENWALTFQTDIDAAVNLIKLSLPHLEKSTRSPCIITIASVSGVSHDMSAPGPYGPFKAALIHYSHNLARELAPKGVRVNIVSPGNIYDKDGFWGSVEKGNKEFFDKMIGLNPTGRMGTTKEVADAVVFLSSPRSSFTSGANLMVDGVYRVGTQF
ncbi:short-chain dehydrogenase/reductase SDR [Sistotremastrum niveocremeum HHB9708]|uniref:Short-chain dehydrogenase/reductase SDR n=1 Tax=Sistotremastrum niveocremeum HHB9708 TaxID=1314777 RepID=A0A164NKR7_9AGAM|nr:short-chain dehydrogenase/reductase SDR [Sistotremastrum niveocremeum HHB9708]